jgi:hypothetical protein
MQVVNYKLVVLKYRNSLRIRSDIDIIMGLYNSTACLELCNSVTLNNSNISGYPKSSLPHYICLYWRSALFKYRVICMSQADINPYATSRCLACLLARLYCTAVPLLEIGACNTHYKHAFCFLLARNVALERIFITRNFSVHYSFL